jgi:hypothetical protein
VLDITNTLLEKVWQNFTFISEAIRKNANASASVTGCGKNTLL